jgi:hypothetical protein
MNWIFSGGVTAEDPAFTVEDTEEDSGEKTSTEASTGTTGRRSKVEDPDTRSFTR